MFLGVNEKYEFRDVTTPNDHAEELKIRLKIIYEQVNNQLEITRTQMQAQYNKKLNFNDYKVGDQAWLKKKYYKTGENRKLSPRRTGPWTIVDKMPNGVNFRVRNNSSGQTQIVHHDRLIPQKKYVDPEINIDEGPEINIDKGPEMDKSDSNDTIIRDSSSSGDDHETNIEIPENRYPIRNRRQRVIEGAIPWDSISI